MSAAPKGWTSTRDSHDNAKGRTAATKREVRYEGRSLNGFRIVREIACGGMATVYLGHRIQHARVGQAAAVKVIHPHLARNPDFVNMFLDEARIVSSISHPNVCRVLDFGHAQDTYYLAMEYVLGESLADLLVRMSRSRSTESIAVPLITQVMYQVCEALHAVHEARDAEGKPLHVVHRDISPQNIMVGYDGCVRVLDFGVARATERLHITRAGVIKGRLAYMAPEQMRGAAVDRRADLWSVGAVLWEGLAGKRLFKRDNDVQTIHAVTLEPVPPVPARARPLPESLQRVVARALERDPARRYDTARELGLDLLRSESQQAHASMSDVSAWMHSLFSEAIAQKRELLREAALAASAEKRDEPIDVTVEEEDEEEAETRVAVPVPPEIRRAAMAATGASGRSESGAHRAEVRKSGIRYSSSKDSTTEDFDTFEHAPKTAESSGVQPTERARQAALELNVQAAKASRGIRAVGQLLLTVATFVVVLAVPHPWAAPSSEVARGSRGEYAQKTAVASSAVAPRSAASSRSDQPMQGVPTTPHIPPQDMAVVTQLTEAPATDVMPAAAPPAALEAPAEALIMEASQMTSTLTQQTEPKAAPSALPGGVVASEPRAAPRARAIPRTLPLGLVNIEATNGWAHVFYGTRKIGTTPLRTSLPVGTRVLRFLPHGKGPILVRRIEVGQKSPTTLTLTLE